MKKIIHGCLPSLIAFSVISVGNTQSLDANYHRPVLSPDGSKIAFMAQTAETGGDWELFLMDADGHNVVRLTDHAGWDGYAVFSSDGRGIYFDRGDAGVDIKQPYYMDLTDHSTHQMSDVEGWISITSLRQQALYAFWEQDGQRDLYRLNQEGRIETKITDTPNLTETDATISPSGRALALAVWPTSDDGEFMLDLIDMDGGERATLVRSAERLYGLSWSPDERSIAYTTTPAGEENAEIFVFDTVSQSSRRLTHNDDWDHMPVWTPDGTIMFTSYRTGQERIYKMDAMGKLIGMVCPDGLACE